MPRPTVNPTDKFYKAVADYQRQHKLKSWSQAVLHLAALGLEQETGKPSPEAYKQHGGWRGKEASLKALMAYADRVSDGGRNDPGESDE
jgi:hypothetical protein